MKQLQAIWLILSTTFKAAVGAVVAGLVGGGGIWLLQHGWGHPEGPVFAGAYLGLGAIVCLVAGIAAFAILGAFFKLLAAGFENLSATYENKDGGDDAKGA